MRIVSALHLDQCDEIPVMTPEEFRRTIAEIEAEEWQNALSAGGGTRRGRGNHSNYSERNIMGNSYRNQLAERPPAIETIPGEPVDTEPAEWQKPTGISHGEWLAELERCSSTPAVADNADGATVAELVAKTGRSVASIRRLLRSGIDAGTVESAMGYRPAIDGRMRPVPVYRLRKQKSSPT